jgi:RNA polymerase sigma-70 factor (ECF subfamily)
VSALLTNSALGDLLAYDPSAQTAASRAAPGGGVGVVRPGAASPAPAGEPRLIDLARRGDRSALSALLRDLQDPWYRLSLSMLRDPDQAAEAVQETGLRFLKQVAGFRGDSQLRTWSLGIAINVVREIKRRRARAAPGGDGATRQAESVSDGKPSAHARTDAAEQRAALRAVLDDLPDRQREAVVLRFFEDLSVDETARVMGCAEGTVKATVHQAVRSLRKRLRAWA